MIVVMDHKSFQSGIRFPVDVLHKLWCFHFDYIYMCITESAIFISFTDCILSAVLSPEAHCTSRPQGMHLVCCSAAMIPLFPR